MNNYTTINIFSPEEIVLGTTRDRLKKENVIILGNCTIQRTCTWPRMAGVQATTGPAVILLVEIYTKRFVINTFRETSIHVE